MSIPPRNLLSLTPDELEAELRDHFASRGEPSYRAGQVRRWIFEGDAVTPTDMTDLPVAERQALGDRFVVREPRLAIEQRSVDGTLKHLWELEDGQRIESVLIPTVDRLTLCISSQAGCAMGCTFCATGWGGFGRQLDPGEIVGQYRAAARLAVHEGLGPITNIVFMGMGEPLANRAGVFPALTLLNAGYGVGARRITVSTVGLVPGILELAARPEQFRLALSLHAPLSELRRELIPLEKRYPLPEVMEALSRFNRSSGRRITFEYTMIRGVNDGLDLVPHLIELALEVGAFVNLIPFNPIPERDWVASRPGRIRDFVDRLATAGVDSAVREPRGRDIDAACGQLRASASSASSASGAPGAPGAPGAVVSGSLARSSRPAPPG